MCGLAGEAKLAGAAFSEEAGGELELAAGFGGNGGVRLAEAGEGKEAVGLIKAEAAAELTGGGAEDAAAEGRIERLEAV